MVAPAAPVLALLGRLVHGVDRLASGFLRRANDLVGDAFGLQSLVADRLADRFLDSADALLGRAFDTFFAHGHSSPETAATRNATAAARPIGAGTLDVAPG